MRHAIIFGAIIFALPLMAQEQTPPAAESVEPDYSPLTLKQNYAWSLDEIFSPQRLTVVVMRAGLDHALRGSDKWGSDAPNYGIRTASWLGRNLVRENIAFGIRAMDGEDPRYVRAGQGSVFSRTRYAVAHTFVARGRNGEDMPAWSLLGDYAAPFVSRTWRGGPMQAKRELRDGTVVLATSVGTNIAREFWPDLRKRLRH